MAELCVDAVLPDIGLIAPALRTAVCVSDPGAAVVIRLSALQALQLARRLEGDRAWAVAAFNLEPDLEPAVSRASLRDLLIFAIGFAYSYFVDAIGRLF